MTAPAGCSQRMPYEGSADPAIAIFVSDGHRAEKQAGLATATHDIPKTGSANDTFAIGRDKGEVVSRRSAVAKALRALAPAVLAKSLVEQRFARGNVGRTFFPDRDHL